MMRVNIGGSLVWRERTYQVLFIQENSAVLRDEDGKEIEVAVDELSQAAEPAESNTNKLIRVSRTAQEVAASQDPWHQAICG